MKTKKTAKEKRAEESQKRKEFWNRDREIHSAAPAPQVQAQAERISAKERALRQEAETREFLEYLQRDISVTKEEPENAMNARRKTARKTLIESVNLEDGMPFVEEAVRRMNIGLQEMRVSGVKLVRLIHGYGSSGRGGKIGAGVRKELEQMKKRRSIRGFVAGEEFGPYSEDSRKLADQYPEIVRDPDYGRCNHGITIVII